MGGGVFMKKAIVFILAGVFILVAAAVIFNSDNRRSMEEARTKRNIMNLLQGSGIQDPKISIKGNKVTVEWISADNQANVQRDLSCMEEIQRLVRKNEFICRVQGYVYASAKDMENGEPKGQVTESQLSLNIPSQSKDWFVENYGPPTRTQAAETEGNQP